MSEFNNFYDEFPNPIITTDYTNNAPTNQETVFETENNSIPSNNIRRITPKKTATKLQSLAASLIALIIVPIVGVTSSTPKADAPTSSIESTIHPPTSSQPNEPPKELITEFYGVTVDTLAKRLKFTFSLDFIDENNQLSDFKAYISVTEQMALNYYGLKVIEGGVFPLDMDYASYDNTSVDYSQPAKLFYIPLELTDPTAPYTVDLEGTIIELETPLHLTVTCVRTVDGNSQTIVLHSEEHTINYEPFMDVYIDDEPLVNANNELNCSFNVYDGAFINGQYENYLTNYVITVTDETGKQVVYTTDYYPYPNEISLEELQLTDGQEVTLNIKITATSVFLSDTGYTVTLFDQDLHGYVEEAQATN